MYIGGAGECWDRNVCDHSCPRLLRIRRHRLGARRSSGRKVSSRLLICASKRHRALVGRFQTTGRLTMHDFIVAVYFPYPLNARRLHRLNASDVVVERFVAARVAISWGILGHGFEALVKLPPRVFQPAFVLLRMLGYLCYHPLP